MSLSFLKINPASSYLNDPRDPAVSSPRWLLADLGAVSGSVLLLKQAGEFEWSVGNPGSNPLMACFVDAAGRPIAPEVFLPRVTAVQWDGLVSDVAADFVVANGGFTRIKVPTGATAMVFSVDAGYFSRLLDSDNDFGVWAGVESGTTDWSGNDQLFGSGVADTLLGSSGKDTLLGGLGNDLLMGGIGNDFFFLSEGQDTVDGGQQNRWPWVPTTAGDADLLSPGNLGAVTIDLTARTMSLRGRTDVSYFSGVESFYGSAQSDLVIGSLVNGPNPYGSIVSLSLYGGNDVVQYTPNERSTPWSGGVSVAYW